MPKAYHIRFCFANTVVFVVVTPRSNCPLKRAREEGDWWLRM
jgi:hypothetical protein